MAENDKTQIGSHTDTCDCCCRLGNVDDPNCSCDHCKRVRAGFGIEIAHVCACQAA
jgi:hypothetical protein